MAGDYEAEEILDLYRANQSEQVKSLNETIVLLNTKVKFLEMRVQELIDENEKLPVPRSVEKQIAEIVKENKQLKDDIAFYKHHVPVQIIINRESKAKPTRTGGKLR